MYLRKTKKYRSLVSSQMVPSNLCMTKKLGIFGPLSPIVMEEWNYDLLTMVFISIFGAAASYLRSTLAPHLAT